MRINQWVRIILLLLIGRKGKKSSKHKQMNCVNKPNQPTVVDINEKKKQADVIKIEKEKKVKINFLTFDSKMNLPL